MVYNCSMANKKTVSQKYVKKQFSIVGIALMIYALVVIFMPIGAKICVENGLFPRIDNPKLSFIISFMTEAQFLFFLGLPLIINILSFFPIKEV